MNAPHFLQKEQLMSKTTLCDLHTWQPVALPDGRTAILCGKCGQHGAPLPAEPWPHPIVVSASGANTSLPTRYRVAVGAASALA